MDLEPYTSATSISKAVSEVAAKWKAGLKASLEERINRGQRFSVSMDEYTSKAHSRYMNVNLHHHSAKPIGLGMIRIKGSLPADKAAQMVKDQLEKFGLSEERHIVAIVKDGARVMVKMGEHFEAFQQLCMAHGIHLAVCDLLYEKKSKKKAKAGTRLSDTFQTLSGTHRKVCPLPFSPSYPLASHIIDHTRQDGCRVRDRAVGRL